MHSYFLSQALAEVNLSLAKTEGSVTIAMYAFEYDFRERVQFRKIKIKRSKYHLVSTIVAS